jgi:undecaprenol kinase
VAFEWLFLLLSIFLVFMAELFNSAIENVVDLAADYQFHLRAKRAKDMAAGAVLVISGFSVLAGLIIFVPKVWGIFF